MDGERRPDAVFLMGPTASGKTALALALADRFALALVSVDSALVYRGMDVGTAKPDAATQARHPHALIDIRDPEQTYSAAEFRIDALAAMDAARRAGRIPLLVGGTGLYFRALERGLSALPEADRTLRAELEAAATIRGWPAMHAQLALQDPEAAARIHPNDPQRIQRALEVIALTGRQLTALQRGGSGRLPWRVLKLAVWPFDRAELHRRIAARFDAMLAAGLVEEVMRLRRRPALRADHAAMRAVGYRQAWEYLEQGGSLDTLRMRGIHATRQLAKRQITWLRAERDAFRLSDDSGDAARRVAAFLGQA